MPPHSRTQSQVSESASDFTGMYPIGIVDVIGESNTSLENRTIIPEANQHIFVPNRLVRKRRNLGHISIPLLNRSLSFRSLGWTNVIDESNATKLNGMTRAAQRKFTEQIDFV